MAPKNFNSHAQLCDALNTADDTKYKLNVSAIKYSAQDHTRTYPFAWVSLIDMEEKQFYSGLQIVFKSPDARLPIVFLAQQSGSALCRVNATNKAIIDTMKSIEDKVRSALPTHEQHKLMPILKESNHPMYPDTKAISLKTKYAAIDHAHCNVPNVSVGATLTAYVLRLQKLSLYEGTYRFQWVLHAVGGMEASTHDDMGRGGDGDSSCSAEINDDSLFAMMRGEEAY